MENTRTTLRLPDDLHQLLKDEAKRQRRSVHNLMLSILWQYFEKSTPRN